MALTGLAPDVLEATPVAIINAAVETRLRMLGVKG